jgi:Ca-activated chloride channel family protein
MQTHRGLCASQKSSNLRECLAALIALIALLALGRHTVHAQGCAQCATAEAIPEVSTGDWLLTKQVNEVNVLFLAARKGAPVDGLAQSDISVRDDDKVPAAISAFRTERELPLRVAVAIDTSSSVRPRFRFEQAAASAFFRQTLNRQGDMGFVLGFGNRVTVTQDFVGDPELLSRGVERLMVGGGTAIYDAIRTACERMVRHHEDNIVARVLVVLSDGQNNTGEVTLQGAIDAAQQAEVTIYAISTNYESMSKSAIWGRDLAAEEGNSNLRKLAEQSGGRVLLPAEPNDVAKAFAKIGTELRSRYAVSYKPADFIPDGRYRKIKIEARQSGEKLEIRARKGYYARAASWLSFDSRPAN